MSRFTPKSSDLLNYERHSLWRPAIQVKDMRSGSVSARPLGGDSSGVRGSKGFGRGAAHLPGGRAEHEADHEVDAAFGDRGCGGPLEGPRRRRRRVGSWRAGRAPAEAIVEENKPISSCNIRLILAQRPNISLILENEEKMQYQADMA